VLPHECGDPARVNWRYYDAEPRAQDRLLLHQGHTFGRIDRRNYDPDSRTERRLLPHECGDLARVNWRYYDAEPRAQARLPLYQGSDLGRISRRHRDAGPRSECRLLLHERRVFNRGAQGGLEREEGEQPDRPRHDEANGQGEPPVEPATSAAGSGPGLDIEFHSHHASPFAAC
jgi:hypothetical protein